MSFLNALHIPTEVGIGLVAVSTTLKLASPAFYIRSILNGQTQPHRTTRAVLLLIGLVAFLAVWADGNWVVLCIAATNLVQAIVVMVLSARRGIGGWAPLDIACLVIAIAGVVAWCVTDDELLALYFALAADFMGMVPTLVKTWQRPETESSVAFYAIDTFAAALLLPALSWSLDQVAFPLYLLLIDGVMTLMVLRCRGELVDSEARDERKQPSHLM